MHLTRPPRHLHRLMFSARPAPELGPSLAGDAANATAPADESERGAMRRILDCERIARETAERCEGLRLEQTALLQAQASNGAPENAPGAETQLLAGILAGQLERNRERLEHAEQSSRSAIRLLRDAIDDALARRLAPAGLARRI